MNEDDYLQERIDDQIKWLSSASGKNQQWSESTVAKRKTGGAGAVTLPARNLSENASSS